MSSKLSALATASPHELLAGDLKILASSLERAKQELEALSGGRHTWLDAVINLAKERAADPMPSPPPHIVICMEGGIITSALAAEPIMVTLIDYDTEDHVDRDDLILVPQGDGKFAEAYANVDQASVDSVRTAELIAAVHSPLRVEIEEPRPAEPLSERTFS